MPSQQRCWDHLKHDRINEPADLWQTFREVKLSNDRDGSLFAPLPSEL